MTSTSLAAETGPRLSPREFMPEGMAALGAVNTFLEKSSLGKSLIDLVFLRVSQINACAYCVDLHARDLLAQGEDRQRINSLVTWHEVDFFSERERAALQWAESLTNLTETHAPREHFDALGPHFSEQEVAELTMTIALMNAWNRVGVGLRLPVAKKAF